MRQIIALLIAVLCLGTASACVKKSPVTNNSSPLTVIVMDTTQALLFGAQVQIGKQTFKTSFDGRVVLKPEQVTGSSLTVTCEGFKEKTVSLNGENPLIVALTAKPGKKPKNDVYYPYGSSRSGRKGEVMYKTAMLASAPADGAFYEAEAAAEVVTLSMDEAPKSSHGGTVHANNNVTAGKLTAGEVNDFTKWYFWPRVIDETHKKFIGTWRVAPRERYTVQVTNKNGYPIANYSVNLLDANGNTLFQAVTDNTGKAELWNGLVESQKSKVESQGLKVEGVQELKAGAINTIVLDEPCEHTDDVDVMFVFDATGSMGDELRYLQAEMKDVIARAKDATGGLNIRTGAVVYRDHGDEYITRLSRLTENIKTTQAFIDKQEASGGGDYPEAVPEALMAALNSAGWNESARARIAFLILDAPCHEDSATLALLHEQILNAAALGVRIVPVVCSGLGESGEYLLRAMALATNGTSFFLTDDSGIGNKHLKPTTDSLKVEHLNDMLVRTIVEFSAMPDCSGHWTEEMTEMESDFVPNPFEVKDLTEEERVTKDSRTTLYLLDISGKLIYIYQGNLENAGDHQLSGLPLPMLSTGVYFVKAFYDGEWHTKKILVH